MSETELSTGLELPGALGRISSLRPASLPSAIAQFVALSPASCLSPLLASSQCIYPLFPRCSLAALPQWFLLSAPVPRSSSALGSLATLPLPGHPSGSVTP